MKQAIGPGRAHSLLHLMVLLMACCFCFNGRAASLDLATSATIRDLPRYVDILEDRTGQRPVGSLLQGSDTVWSKTGEQALQISYSTSVWWSRQGDAASCIRYAGGTSRPVICLFAAKFSS